MKIGSKKIVIVGGRLGGISAAIMLRNRGYDVTILEKNSHLGGKLNLLQEKGFSFDLGPSILTLPQYFEKLFSASNRKMSDYFTIIPVKPHWRNFFEDGTVIDLHKEEHLMKQEFLKLKGNPEKHFEEFKSFMAYSKKQYDIVERGYFAKGLDNLWDFIKYYGFFNLGLNIDHKHTMSQSIQNYFQDPYLRDIFEYFIKYVGSSALRSPGFMNLMPNIQFEFDLWYVKGGLFNISVGLTKLVHELGIHVVLNAEVSTINTADKKAHGVTLKNGTQYPADYVISNMEVIPAYQNLLHESDSFMKKLEKFEPSCSGLVLHLGTDKVYPKLAHHNFFFSKDQHKHFKTVFEDQKLPQDPTIYLVAPTRSDPTQAPEGHDNIKILPHIPYINSQNAYTHEDYVQFKDRVLDKLERMGFDFRKHVVFEDMWTPLDIQKKYYSNKGSIYGVVSDWKKNYAFKAPKKSSKYSNLYFVGGSVNPGGGMPMVVLCGQNVAEQIISKDR